MVLIDTLYLAVLTRNIEDADSDSTLNLTINIDGSDVVDYNPGNPTGVGEAHMYGPTQLTGLTLPLIPDKVDPFESTMLTNSSVRLGIRDDDGWRPEHILVLGGDERQVLALAAELDIDRDFPLTTEPDLSTYHAIGNLSMPIRRVGYGSSTTLVRRVLLLVGTHRGENDGTDDPIVLQITAGGNIVLYQEIHDTPQPDLERGSFNWYGPYQVTVPFTRSDLVSNGGIKLSIIGDDAWLPSMVFVLGLDDEPPTQIVTLVSIPDWNMGYLSTDSSEDADQGTKNLPVI